MVGDSPTLGMSFGLLPTNLNISTDPAFVEGPTERQY
jgi:hypothetical protein